MYKLLYHHEAEKFLKKITKNETINIIGKIDLLSKNPFAPNSNAKKLTNASKSYRLRVGNIRIVYAVDSSKQIIYVLDINFRGEIYKN